DQFFLNQPAQDHLVLSQMLGLTADRTLEIDTQPFEVAKDAGLELGRATLDVDILDAQQEAATATAGHLRIQQGRVCMAEVQRAVRTRRETENRGVGRRLSGCA